MKDESKISFNAKLFALSFWMIFFTFEGSFSIQVLLPFLIILLVYTFLIKKEKNIIFNRESKILLLFIASLLISTIINYFTNTEYFNVEVIIGVLYFIVIFMWFMFNTNKNYTSKEINFIITSYICMGLGCSILILLNYLSGKTGKIPMINLINTEIDENYASALIAMVSIYLFYRILNKKMGFAKKIIYIIIFIVEILAVALSGSRAALLSTIIAVFLLFFITYFKNITFKKIISFIFITSILVFSGIKIFNYIPTWTFNRYFGTNYVDNSNTHRIMMWKNGVKGVASSPIYGYSIRIFDKIPEFSSINGYHIPDRVPAHQTYIDIMIYTGLVGFIIFIIFLFGILKIYVKKKNRIFLPVILVFLIITNIIGAERSVLFWNNLIIFSIIGNYIKNNPNYDIKTII